MPRSPLTLLLMVLTLIAFAAHLVSMAAGEWVMPMLSNVGILLAIATTASIVRDGGAFDSRAFHRTRPCGEARAFRNSTLGLAGLVVMVALMGLACLLVLNLRWGLALRFALGYGLPVGFCVAAFAAGFTLVFSSDSRRLLAGLLLILPPVAVALLLTELRIGRSYGIYQYVRSDIYGSTWATLGGITGYSLAWWLAAGRRSRALALMLACGTGACLPLGQRLGFLPGPELPLMPERTVEITRTVPAAPNPMEQRLHELFRADHTDGSRSKEEEARSANYVPIFLGGRLKVRGLREDEFVLSQGLVPWKSKDRDLPAVKVGQGWIARGTEMAMQAMGNESFVLHGDASDEMSGERSVVSYLARRLPAPTHLEGEFVGAPEWSLARRDLDWISVDEKQTSIEAVEASDWRVDGAVYRMEEVGSFDLSRGGWLRLRSGGSIIVSAYSAKDAPGYIHLRMINVNQYADDPAFRHGQGHFATVPVALLRDPTDGATRAVRVEYDTRRYSGGLWQYHKLHIGDPKLGEKLLRSRLYLFKPVPQGRVKIDLPPP